jgi:hypothetical protein
MKTMAKLVQKLGLLAGVCGVAAAVLVAGPTAASAAGDAPTTQGFCRTAVAPEETVALCGRNAYAKWAIGVDVEGGWESGYVKHVEDGEIPGWFGTFLEPEPGHIGISIAGGWSGEFIAATVRPDVTLVVLVTEAGKRIPMPVGPDVRPDHFRYAGTWIELPDEGKTLIGYNAAGQEVARETISL